MGVEGSPMEGEGKYFKVHRAIGSRVACKESEVGQIPPVAFMQAQRNPIAVSNASEISPRVVMHGYAPVISYIVIVPIVLFHTLSPILVVVFSIFPTRLL
jgi:hypothetical protein